MLSKHEILRPIREDLEKVESKLQSLIQMDSNVLYDASFQMLNAGGKRLRPTLVILSGRLFNYKLEKILPIACAVELLHMATLIHDDIIDNSSLRRGQTTPNHRWGNKMAVLSGDLIFTQAIKLLVNLKDHTLAEDLLDTTLGMCKGEAEELLSRRDVDQTIDQYLKRIKLKTARLFSKSCALGARACEATPDEEEKMTHFGLNLGMSFQIIDDLKDLVGTEEELGKPPRSDLKEGVITLPVILALKATGQRELIVEVIKSEHPTQDAIREAVNLIHKSGVIKKTLEFARRYTYKSLNHLRTFPPTTDRKALQSLARYITSQQMLGKLNLKKDLVEA